MADEIEDFEFLAYLDDAMSAGMIELDECGCCVELDGTCPHGNKSPMLEMELI